MVYRIRDRRRTLRKPLLATSIKLALLQFGGPVGLKIPKFNRKLRKKLTQKYTLKMDFLDKAIGIEFSPSSSCPNPWRWLPREPKRQRSCRNSWLRRSDSDSKNREVRKNPNSRKERGSEKDFREREREIEWITETPLLRSAFSQSDIRRPTSYI